MCDSLDDFCEALVTSEREQVTGNERRWTEEEEALLARLHGHVSDATIAEMLGRSEVGVIIHWKREMHLSPPTTDPDYITALRIALALGTDVHKTASWIDRGIMPGEYIPRRDNHLHRRVLRTDFIAWLQDPQNWVWFDFEKVKDAELRQLISEAREKWGDEWWKTPQVARYHGVHVHDVKRYIKLGRIKARRVDNIGGRDRATWAYWFVLKSEATRKDLVFVVRRYK
jgi:hypothetical protein